MEKNILFSDLSTSAQLNYDKFTINSSNLSIKQEYDKKFDFLLDGLLEDNKSKSKL